MVAAKEWTKIDPKDDKILSLTTLLSKLDEIKTSVLANVQVGWGNINHTLDNIKGKYPNKSYIQVINNIESWIVKKSEEKVARDGQYWWWFPKHNTGGKFNGMYMNHPDNNHD